MRVDIRLTPGLKALGFQPVESTIPFKVLVSADDVNLHPYAAVRGGAGVVQSQVRDKPVVNQRNSGGVHTLKCVAQ